MVNEEFLNNMKEVLSNKFIKRSNSKNTDVILKNLLSFHLEGYATDVWSKEPPHENDELYLVEK